MLAYDVESSLEELQRYCRECEFVFHLAGVNRPKDIAEFAAGNVGFTEQLLAELSQQGNQSPVLITSSIQAEQDNHYGTSKKAAEDLIFAYGEKKISG